MQKFTNHFYRRKRNFTNSDTASVKFVDPDKLRVFHEPVFLVLKRGFIQEQNNMCSSDCYSSTCIISTFMTHFYFAICFDDIILLIQFSFSIPIDIGSNLLYFYLNQRQNIQIMLVSDYPHLSSSLSYCRHNNVERRNSRLDRDKLQNLYFEFYMAAPNLLNFTWI